MDKFPDDYYKIGEHGYVKLIDMMGNDEDICKAARVSYGKHNEIKTTDDDRSLIRRLMRDKHTSPFEMVEMKFQISMPIFVCRQWIRHRTANVNEYSGRYSEMPCNFYVPEIDVITSQDKNNKQGGVDTLLLDDKLAFIEHCNNVNMEAEDVYHKSLNEHSISRELARINLPLSLFTELVWKCDLHNILHFLKLRVDPHAQYQIREYAYIIEMIVQKYLPQTYDAWVNYIKEAVTFSKIEMEILHELLESNTINYDKMNTLLSKNEQNDFLKKIKNT